MSAEALEQDGGEEHRLAAVLRYDILDSGPEAEFDRVVRLTAQICEAPMAVLSFHDRERAWFKANQGFPYEELPRQAALCRHVVRYDHFCLAADTLAQDPFMRERLVLQAPHLRFFAGAPLRSPDGYVLGALSVYDTQPRPEFGPAEVQAIEDLAEVALDLLHLRIANRHLAEMATIDELTGVANRRRFLELAEAELVRSVRYDTPVSLVLIDLDGFKQINERIGNAGGDAALRHAATVFGLVARRPDIVGRVGGAEFAVIMPQTNALDAARGAERLRERLIRSPFNWCGIDVPLAASFGVAEGTNVSSVEHWIDRAERALYAAKDGGRNRVVVNPSRD